MLVKAREFFEANKDGRDEKERPQAISASEWRQILEEDMEETEEDMFEDEEDEGLLEADEEESAEEDAEGDEPAAKKQKTG